ARLVLLFRTTTFKLTLLHLGVFALFAVSLLGYFAWNTSRAVNEQIMEAVNAEASELIAQHDIFGIRRLKIIVEDRTGRPGSNLYYLTSFTGERLAGNVESLTAGVLDRNGWTETSYRRLDDLEGPSHRALARVEQLPGGFRLLVGRDLEERERLL